MGLDTLVVHVVSNECLPLVYADRGPRTELDTFVVHAINDECPPLVYANWGPRMGYPGSPCHKQ